MRKQGMGLRLNDIISCSEKKRTEQADMNCSCNSATVQQVALNVLTLEEQQRYAQNAPTAQPKKHRVTSTPARTHQVKTRLSSEEKQFFDQRVLSSGLSQGDFMRQILLHESVEIHNITGIDAEALGVLAGIASELGRIGGMIRGTVIQNKGEFKILEPWEKVNLEREIRELNRLKAEIQKAVQMIYGNH